MTSDLKQIEKDDKALKKKSFSDGAIKNLKENQALKRLILLFVKILVLISIFFLVFFVVFGFTRMDDNSMYPNIKNGDLLFYYRLEDKFSNGDVVVVNRGEGDLVYRIVAQPGQTVDIVDEKLSIDEQPSTVETFYETEKDKSTVLKYPYKIPEDSYFVINDFRSDTNDSRKFGQISRDKIKGRLITKIQIRDL